MDTRSQITPDQPDPRRWIALAVLCAAFFMICLDGQIVLLALPSIEAQLGFSPAAVQWVVSAYMLALGGLLLLGGRMADLWGRRRLFMVSTVIFLLASLACGLANDQLSLIIARIVQGVAAAAMTPSALAILMTTFHGPERDKALGLWSAMGAGGATAALLIGGPLTDFLGWRWVFFINIPICALIVILSPLIMPESKASGIRRGFDFGGAISITAALVLFVFMITEIPVLGWTHPQTVGLAIASLVLFVSFLAIERRIDNPLVPLAIFRSRSFVGGNLIMLISGILVFGQALLVSLYAQKVLGYSPLLVGLGTMIYSALSIVTSTLTGRWIGRVGARTAALSGMVLMSLACGLFAFIRPDGNYAVHLLPGLLVFGPGIGMAAVASSVAALSRVKESEAGLASGINSSMFQIGGALGVALATTIAVSRSQGLTDIVSLNIGYAAGFWSCATIGVLGVLVALTILTNEKSGNATPAHMPA